MRKVRTYSVNSSSTLFYFSISAMYNRVNHAQTKYLVLKLYIPGIDSLFYPKVHYEFFLWKLVNELHDWIEKYPHVIQYPKYIRLVIRKNQW